MSITRKITGNTGKPSRGNESQPQRVNFDRDLAKFHPRQLEAVAKLESGIKFLLYGGCLGGGKLLSIQTPIPTLGGWTTMGEIVVGDQVFDETGSPCNVIAVSEGQYDKTFCIYFSDGSEIIAGASHEWVTETNSDRVNLLRRTDNYRVARRAKRPLRGVGKRPDLSERNKFKNQSYLPLPIPSVKTTQEIHDTLMDGVQTNHSIPVCKPLVLPNIDLLVPPYVLGVWLGDGTSSSGDVTGIDDNIFSEIQNAGYVVSNRASVLGHGVIGLKAQLRKIGVLNNKHIPIVYLRSSASQRLALLQGLMDTDGYCDARGQCEIQVTSKALAKGIKELICSLGIKVQLRIGKATLYGKDHGEKYRLKFITGLPVFRLARKLDRQKRDRFRGTHNRRYIVAVKEISQELMKCIEVDSSSHLYLAGESMIPTHNSYLLRWYVLRRLLELANRGIKNAVGMLACEDFPSLKDRQISKISTEFPQIGELREDHKIHGRSYILAPEYGSGVIAFRNLDDPSKYQSAEFALIAVDELTKNVYDTFTYLRTRLRWPGLRDNECQFVAGTNPGGVGHGWVKNLWMDGIFPKEFISPVDYRPLFSYVPSKATDNPHLDPSYWAMLDTLPLNLRSAFRDGDWNVFVGQAFPEFGLLHRCSPMPIPVYAPIYMTQDWGFGAPFSVGWWWVDADGRLYRFAEWYGWSGSPNVGLRLSDSQVAEGIKERETKLGLAAKQITRILSPDCFAKKANYLGGGQGKSTAEVYADHGLYARPGDARRNLKIRQVRERFRIPLDGISKPMVQIYETCDQFLRTISSLVMDKNNIEDVDTGGEDHCYDEFALLAMARPMVLQVPSGQRSQAQHHIERVTRPRGNYQERELEAIGAELVRSYSHYDDPWAAEDQAKRGLSGRYYQDLD